MHYNHAMLTIQLLYTSMTTHPSFFPLSDVFVPSQHLVQLLEHHHRYQPAGLPEKSPRSGLGVIHDRLWISKLFEFRFGKLAIWIMDGFEEAVSDGDDNEL
jgi:hypothetical protein